MMYVFVSVCLGFSSSLCRCECFFFFCISWIEAITIISYDNNNAVWVPWRACAVSMHMSFFFTTLNPVIINCCLLTKNEAVIQPWACQMCKVMNEWQNMEKVTFLMIQGDFKHIHGCMLLLWPFVTTWSIPCLAQTSILWVQVSSSKVSVFTENVSTVLGQGILSESPFYCEKSIRTALTVHFRHRSSYFS